MVCKAMCDPCLFLYFIIQSLPHCPLCFSHRKLCRVPELVLFLETLDFLFLLPKMLLLQIFSGFTQCSGASLNMTSQERLFLTTKGEVVSLFSLPLHSDMFSSYHLVCVITSSYICLLILCSWAPECKLHESKSAVFPVYHCIFSAQNLPEMQGKLSKYL